MIVLVNVTANSWPIGDVFSDIGIMGKSVWIANKSALA